jgi:hypothetical protein
MTGPVPSRPDPWSVVDHHAREAAARGTDAGQMNDRQRLALYVATAPDVIGARRIDAGVLGHTVRRAGGAGAEWWAVPLPGEQRELAWSSTGILALRQPSRGVVVAFAIGMLGFLMAFGGFGRVAGPRALIPALLVGGGLFVAVRRAASDWSLVDGDGDTAIRGAIRGFVGRYEDGVGGEGEQR